MMMAIAGLTFYQVIMRYVFSSASSWSEELIRFIFIWCSFMAAAIGVREGIHIGINIFVNLLPRRLVPLTEIVVNLAILVFAGCLVYYGWQKWRWPTISLPGAGHSHELGISVHSGHGHLDGVLLFPETWMPGSASRDHRRTDCFLPSLLPC